MCINIIPQNGIIQVGLHCQLDDIDDFRGFAAEKCRTEDFVAFSINNSLRKCCQTGEPWDWLLLRFWQL